MVTLYQLKVLLWRNILIKKKDKILTILEGFIPFFILFIIKTSNI